MAALHSLQVRLEVDGHERAIKMADLTKQSIVIEVASGDAKLALLTWGRLDKPTEQLTVVGESDVGLALTRARLTPQISQIDQERFFKEHVLKRDLTESSNVQYLKDRLKPADVLFCYGLVDLIEPLTRQAQLNSLLELVKIGGKVVFAMSCDSPLQYGKPLKGFTCEMQVASGSQHDANQNYVPEIKHMQSFVGKLEEKSFREKIKEMIEHLPAVVTEVHECTSMSESDTTQYSKWYNEAQNELAKKQSAPRPDDLLKAVETRRLAHCGKLESNTAEQTSVTESKGFYRHIGTYRNLIVLQKTDNAIPVARGQGASGVSVDKPDVQKSKPRQIARMTTGGKGPRKTLKKK